MSTVFDYEKLGHHVFIVFIELKIDGSWKKYNIPDEHSTNHEVLAADHIENCIIHIIEPDGLRRILNFTKGGTISIHENVFSYKPKHVSEITVDEKEQSGNGKTRDRL